MIETNNKLVTNIFFKIARTTKLINLINMTQNMKEIETLLSKTMLRSCFYTMFFKIVLNHNPLEQASVYYPYCRDISYILGYIMLCTLSLQSIL